jgi:hypothetical protein
MTPEMVERVAQRLLKYLEEDSFGHKDNLSSITVDGVIDLRDLASEAIAEMREPTEAMVEAGRKGMERNEFRDGWSAAIDEAQR